VVVGKGEEISRWWLGEDIRVLRDDNKLKEERRCRAMASSRRSGGRGMRLLFVGLSLLRSSSAPP
jgi:hypothetical protein